MSHGKESELQARRLARYKPHAFSAGSAKDGTQPASQRLERYRERLQRALNA
ncbi:hypothetical protein [Halomonas sp. CSM-2]|uniref:hypothetical protein n=1 Tax=Halomonas sp. CSM-2 TaxID=1975722 RepID=UPI001593CEB1|nr:hypothetical protein [Halomonas sp. CSM-2]